MIEHILVPRNEDEVAQMLKEVVNSGQKLLIRGHGSKQSWGPPRGEHHITLSTNGLVYGLKHDRDDLVVSTPTGLSWLDLQKTLATAGQWIALDPPLARRSTVGGVVAAATSGPRRLAYGSVRDQVIGARAVLPDGRVIRAGGRVIKNVAGYDLCKLLVGSFGTLAVITEVTFKVLPLPECRAAVTVPCPDLDTAHRLGLQIMRSQLQPAAVQLLWEPAATLRIDVDGLEAVVNRQVREVANIIKGQLGEAAQSYHVEGPHPVRSGEDMLSAVEAQPSYPSPDHTVIRCGVPAARWVDALRVAHKELSPCGATPWRVDLGTGLLWWTAPVVSVNAGQALSALAGAVARLDRQLAGLGGYATVQSGPWPVRRWASELQQNRFVLGERVRRLFDPTGVFRPLPLHP